MTDLQATVTASLAPALKAVDDLAKRMGNLEAQTRRANRAAKQLQDTASKPMAVGKGVAAGAAALDKSGAGIFGKMLGGAGMGGSFGALAVGAGVAGIALRAFNSVIDANVTRLKMATQAQRENNDAITAGTKAVEAQASASRSRNDSRRDLLAAGGKDAANAADAVAANGLVSREDANAGVAAIYRRTSGKRAQAAVMAAEQLAAVGIPFTEAAEKVAGGRGSLDTAGGTSRLRNRIYGETFKNGRSFGDAYQDTGDVSLKVGSDGLLGAGQRNAQIGSRIAAVEDAAALAEDAGGNQPARLALAQAANPVAAAILELSNKRAIAIEAQKAVAEAEGKFGAFLKDAGAVLGGEGSGATQAKRMMIYGGGG